MERIWELANGKCIRKYSPEHPLFDAGTRLWAAKYYQKPEYVDSSAVEITIKESDEFFVMFRSMVQPKEKVDEDKQPSSLTCRLANCNVSFQSVTAYEEHYDMMHRNVCRECSRSFLSLRLLDIHISETHDAFFKILSKKKPMYVCLVDGCPETFQHDDKRTRHLVQVHQYPESFSFHKRKAKGKTTNREETNEPEEVDAETIKKREARKRRRQQKKKRVQEKLQNSDMQVDAGAETQGDSHNEVASSEPIDVDMVELEESMRQLRIPKSIRFGRKRRV